MDPEQVERVGLEFVDASSAAWMSAGIVDGSASCANVGNKTLASRKRSTERS